MEVDFCPVLCIAKMPILQAFWAINMVLKLLGADTGLTELGRNYLRIVLIATPCFMCNYTFTGFARNDEAPMIAMIASITGSLCNIVLDYIMDSEVPKPCRHFIGRDKELEELYTMLEENRHVFLCGIAGIGKSELAKAYAKRYMRHYTNILYVEYTGDLHQDITDMDFIDDLPESTEQERFQRHNRFLRSLKSDTLLIIDNFNVTATQDSFLSVVLKYRCQILFTTRSKLDKYCTLPLK